MRNILFAISTLLSLCVLAPGQSSPLPGLKESVTVRRDSRSIPYVEASNEPDLYFAQGYVTASDRVWRMELLRRVARGETAEIFGKATLEEDKRWRRFGFSAIADESLAYLSPQLRTGIESYARGVNAYIARLDDKTLPIEFRILQYKPREWRAADSIVIGKILADALSSTWRNDLLRASLQKLPNDKLADLTNQVTPYDVVWFGKDGRNAERGTRNLDERNAERGTRNAEFPEATAVTQTTDLPSADKLEELRASSLSRVGMYAEELAASNNWVISGKRTADGKPLLA